MFFATADPYYISMLMKMCRLVHGSLASKLNTLTIAICVVELHQVLFLELMLNKNASSRTKQKVLDLLSQKITHVVHV